MNLPAKLCNGKKRRITMSQDNICITKTHTYGPPCFLDEDNEPNCSYDITECGMSLADIPRNEETEELFQTIFYQNQQDY